jgi:ribonucleoside-diphosphate reductase alpha chain
MAGMKSKTTKKSTNLGSAFITICFDDKDKPSSMLINLGKSGSDTRAISEALGRLVTLTLKDNSIETVIGELKDITSSRCGVGNITLPQAIAETLEINGRH